MGRTTITCTGCGQVLGLAADDPRTEIECLLCGTKIPLEARPPGAASPRPAPSPPPRPAPRRPRPPRPAPASEDAPARPAEEPPAEEPRWSEQTPYALQEAPPTPPPPDPALSETPLAGATSSRRSRPAVPQPPSEDEDSAPYQFEGPPDEPCPGCNLALPADTVLCPSCGFNRKTGKRARRRYEPVRRSWEMGWPRGRRVRLFVLGQVLAVPLGLLGAWVLGGWGAFVGPWLVFTALTAFLLGTYSRTDLSRNERGKVQLLHTWHVCFFARPTQTLRLGEFDGVVSGKAPAADFWDWFVAIILLVMGFVGGVLWWVYVIRRDSFFVALTRDHGHPELTLYWGWNEEQTKDMANTIRAVAFSTT
jgi:DNA-directed RNA polymerase subunit RPC12/RpoP